MKVCLSLRFFLCIISCVWLRILFCVFQGTSHPSRDWGEGVLAKRRGAQSCRDRSSTWGGVILPLHFFISLSIVQPICREKTWTFFNWKTSIWFEIFLRWKVLQEPQVFATCSPTTWTPTGRGGAVARSGRRLTALNRSANVLVLLSLLHSSTWWSFPVKADLDRFGLRIASS